MKRLPQLCLPLAGVFFRSRPMSTVPAALLIPAPGSYFKRKLDASIPTSSSVCQQRANVRNLASSTSKLASGRCDFGGFTVRPMTAADAPDVERFLNEDFLHTEPLNRSVSFTEADAATFFKDIIGASAPSSLSYVVKSPDGDVAAVRLCSMIDRPKKGASEEGVFTVDDSKPGSPAAQMSEKAKAISRIVGALEDKIWVLVDPTMHRLMYLLVISVSSNFTRRGLADKLLNYKLDEAKQMGCQGVITEATSFNSQQLFKKRGYQMLYEIRHEDWLDENGKRIFKCDDGTDSSQLYFKVL